MMKRTVAISALLFTASSLAQDASAIESDILAAESAIESYLPGGEIPSKTAIAEDLASFVTAVTAQPEFSNAVSVLETAVPSSVVDALSADPEGVLASLATAASPPAWVTAIPTSVVEYISSIGAEAISIVVEELPTGAYNSLLSGAYASVSAPLPTGTGYAAPTGGNLTRPTPGPVSPATFTAGAASSRVGAVVGAAGMVGVGLMLFA